MHLPLPASAKCLPVPGHLFHQVYTASGHAPFGRLACLGVGRSTLPSGATNTCTCGSNTAGQTQQRWLRPLALPVPQRSLTVCPATTSFRTSSAMSRRFITSGGTLANAVPCAS